MHQEDIPSAKAESLHVVQGRNKRKVRRILPQAECHLSWEHLYHTFDIYIFFIYLIFRLKHWCAVKLLYKS